MATTSYTPLNDPSSNLRKLIQEQNAAGAEFGVSSGWEPFEVLVTKAVFNAANTGGSLGDVTSVNGQTGVVVLTKNNIGLGNVPNTDATNASNLSSGTVPNARFPATLPASSGVNLTALNASNLASGTAAVAVGGTGQTSYTNGQLLIGNTATGGLSKATLTAGANITITNGTGTITIASTGGGGGSGNVTGPGSSTDNAIARFNGTAGDTIQNSGVTIDDTNNMTVPGDVTVSGDFDISGATITGGTGTGTLVRQTNAALNGGTVDSYNIGYKEIPINSQSAAYGTLLSDSGKAILHPSTDNNARTFTIPANASVAYPVGTAITFINYINTLSIAITTDTMTLFAGTGTGTTGTRTLAAGGTATAIKTGTTSWVISGIGLT